MHVLVAAVHQRHRQRVMDPAALCLGIPHETRPPEVHFCDLAQQGLGHPDRAVHRSWKPQFGTTNRCSEAVGDIDTLTKFAAAFLSLQALDGVS